MILKFIFFTLFQILTAQNIETPANFPKSMPLTLTTFECWSREIKIDNIWTATPTSTQDILDAANWAMKSGYQIRASGFMHNWSPFTIPPRQRGDSKLPPKIILLRTTKYLKKMRVISNSPGDSSFWAQPGITMVELTKTLELYSLGFSAIPAIGEITLGGVLAIGGHGTGVPALGEVKESGHTYGTLSNLIIAFTAIVYDENLGQYVLKYFHRSEVESKAFLTNLGRTFLTNVTMRVGPLQNLQCLSRTDIYDDQIFAPPSRKPRMNSLEYFMDKTGRVEVTIFPFTKKPWVKIWTVTDIKPEGSREVISSCNYIFTCSMHPGLSASIAKAAISSFLPRSIAFSQAMYLTLKETLHRTNTENLWGSSAKVFRYVKEDTLRVTANGYGILTSRSNVQRAVHLSYKFYKDLLFQYAARQMFPINGLFEIRVSGVDHPEDVGIVNAESPALSAAHPDPTRPEFDCVIWLNVITQHKTPGANSFMTDYEKFMIDTFNGEWGILRAEWSKGWAYTPKMAWTNRTFLTRNIPNSLPKWEEATRILKGCDPHNVFTNSFLNTFV